MEREIKDLYRRFVAQVINKGEVEAIGDYVVEDVIDSGHAGFGSGRDAMVAFVEGLHTGFPDIHMSIDWMVEENGRLAVWAPMTGTHTGEFLGIEPTGWKVTFDTCGFFRYEIELIVEHQGFIDMLTLAETLAAVQGPPWN